MKVRITIESSRDYTLEWVRDIILDSPYIKNRFVSIEEETEEGTWRSLSESVQNLPKETIGEKPKMESSIKSFGISPFNQATIFDTSQDLPPTLVEPNLNDPKVEIDPKLAHKFEFVEWLNETINEFCDAIDIKHRQKWEDLLSKNVESFLRFLNVKYKMMVPPLTETQPPPKVRQTVFNNRIIEKARTILNGRKYVECVEIMNKDGEEGCIMYIRTNVDELTRNEFDEFLNSLRKV